MSERRHSAWIVAATVLLPVVGTCISGHDIRSLAEFPPKLRVPVEYPRFSWLAVALVVTPFAILGADWFWRYRSISQDRSEVGWKPIRKCRRLPVWALAAFAWTAIWWVLAWSRFPWFAPLQRYTFAPLWFGFIISVNGLIFCRTGTCAMIRLRLRWIGLFAASSLFWWVFEWLNRFSNNWHYLAVSDFTPTAYAVHATICFSTVLPAVTAVAELLTSSNGWQASCARGPAIHGLRRKPVGGSLVAAGALALVVTGRVKTSQVWSGQNQPPERAVIEGV